MEKVSATRQQLLMLKGQRAVVSKGLDLLKSKREALMKEFFGIIEESLKLRGELTSLLNKAYKDLELAKALNGASLESFAHAVKRDVPVDIKVENVWGLSVPEIRETAVARGMDARDVSPVGESILVLDVASEFESVCDSIIRIASKETRLQRVGEMIKSDTRKINAIGEVMLPSMTKAIRGIERVLEEREREEVFRLKRHKAMSARKEV